jgi:hypothetical protein
MGDFHCLEENFEKFYSLNNLIFDQSADDDENYIFNLEI